jgi:hypothetical protein
MIQTPLMVINNLDIFWPLACPNKAHAKLVVNANAVLPGTIMFQCLQSITRDYQVGHEDRQEHLPIQAAQVFVVPQTQCS